MSVVMIVDDDPGVLTALKRTLRKMEWQLLPYLDTKKALDAAADLKIDMLIVDYCMPEMNGLEFLARFQMLQPDAISVLLTGSADLNLAIKAINESRIDKFIAKPWENSALLACLCDAFLKKKKDNNSSCNAGDDRVNLVDRETAEMLQLEQEFPGITKVRWDKDGSIILYE